jgi:sulfur dioxygenase
MLFRQMFDRESSTFTYLIAEPFQRLAILVDPVLEQVDRDLKLLQELNLVLHSCLETHIHDDHVTGAAQLRSLTGCQVVVPAQSQVFGADRFIEDGEMILLGKTWVEALATPGHTNSHLAYQVDGDRILTGDALLIRSCCHADFQGGDPGTLYDSVTNYLFALPEETLVYPGHSFDGQTISTIGEEKRANPYFVGYEREDFVAMMRSLRQPKPKKILEALPANAFCGTAA